MQSLMIDKFDPLPDQFPHRMPARLLQIHPFALWRAPKMLDEAVHPAPCPSINKLSPVRSNQHSWPVP